MNASYRTATESSSQACAATAAGEPIDPNVPANDTDCPASPRPVRICRASASRLASGVTQTPDGWRAEARPRQPGPQPVPQLAPGLRHVSPGAPASAGPSGVPRCRTSRSGWRLRRAAAVPWGSAATARGGHAAARRASPPRAARDSACLADFSSTPSSASTSTSVAVQTAAPRGSANSPSTVISSERALVSPSSRRRLTACRGLPPPAALTGCCGSWAAAALPAEPMRASRWRAEPGLQPTTACTGVKDV